MLPPVLETYVVWHPGDREGEAVAEKLMAHFHGTLFSGLISGAMELYVRSVGWRGSGDAPRPIGPITDPHGPGRPSLCAVVPLLGHELAHAVQTRQGAWYEYLQAILAAQRDGPDRVGIFPLVLHRGAVDGTELGLTINRFHGIGRGHNRHGEAESERWCRDLSQGIAQFAGGIDGNRLTVFISHTTQPGPRDEGSPHDLIAQVRMTIGETRLSEFFSTHDLQIGTDWSDQLRSSAASSAMLAVRTDRYASRPWCQREMLIAKCAGMPVVVLDALSHGEERGSFLMDHVPRVPVRYRDGGWQGVDIRRGVNLLVDECLRRVLWRRQRELAEVHSDLAVSWWAPHAPEPVTLVDWLARRRAEGRLDTTGVVRILHPDPPLGLDERQVLDQIAEISGLAAPLDVLTPRSLAARGG